MFRDVPNFKKLELRTELQMVEPKTNRTSNRTQDFRPNRTIVSNRTELRSFSLILTNHIVLQCFDTLAVILMIFIDHFLSVLFSQTWQVDYILDSPKWVVITELQVYCNSRIFGKKIKLLIKLIENRRKKQRKKTFKAWKNLSFQKFGSR